MLVTETQISINSFCLFESPVLMSYMKSNVTFFPTTYWYCLNSFNHDLNSVHFPHWESSHLSDNWFLQSLSLGFTSDKPLPVDSAMNEYRHLLGSKQRRKGIDNLLHRFAALGTRSPADMPFNVLLDSGITF